MREDASPLDLSVLVEPAQALVHRSRSKVLGVDEVRLPPVDQEVVVRPSRMLDDAFGLCGDVGPRAAP